MWQVSAIIPASLMFSEIKYLEWNMESSLIYKLLFLFVDEEEVLLGHNFIRSACILFDFVSCNLIYLQPYISDYIHSFLRSHRMTKFRIMVQCRFIRKLCVFDDKAHFNAFISKKAARTWKESSVTQNSIPSAKKIREYPLQKNPS